METVTLLHYLTDEAGKADVDGLVRNLSGRLEGSLEGNSDLLGSRADLDILATVLRLVNDRRRKRPGELELVTRPTLDNLNLKTVIPMIKRMNDSNGRLDVLMEPLYRIYCELHHLQGQSPEWLLTEDCIAELTSDGVQCRAAVQTLYCLLELSQSYPSMQDLLKSSTDRLLLFLPLLLKTEYLAKFSIIVKKLLSLHEDDNNNDERLGIIWGLLVEKETDHNDALLVLCTLADCFLGADTFSLEVYAKEELWRLVQAGLSESDALSRKRALYVLKRAVDNVATLRNDLVTESVSATVTDYESGGVSLFHWSRANHVVLSTLWEDYILIIEMLEETQVHIIKPLLPRWQTIINAASSTVDGTRPMLHTSWLLVLLKRTCEHSSGLLGRWGIEQFLDLDATKVPLISQGGCQFMTKYLPEMLNQAVHYQRDLTTPLTDCPPIAEKLVTFLCRYWSALGDDEKRSVWLRAMLRSVDGVSWSGLALMFVVRAFSLLPRTAVLDSLSLDVLRNICSQHIRTVYINQRGAVQVFVTKTMINLIDPCQTSLVDVFRLLAMIKADESYERGSRVWTQLCGWLKSNWTDTADQLESMVRALLGKEDTSVYSTLPADCVSLGFAKLFYLHIDSGCRVDQVRAESLVYPLFDTAASANQRLYLNRESADNALGAIVKLVELRGALKMEPAFGRLLDQCRSSLLDYTITRLLACRSLDESALYLSALYHLIGSGEEAMTKYVVECVDKLGSRVSKVESSDSAEVVCGLMAVRGLAQCVNVLQNVNDVVTSSAPGGGDSVVLTVLPNLSDLVMNVKRPESESSGVDCRNWNGLVSSAIGAQWRVIAYRLGRSIDKAPPEPLCDRCLSALDVGTNDILEPLLQTLAQIFGKGDVNAELVVRCIDVCWRRLVECGPWPQAFWPAYRAFIDMCYQKRLMERSDLEDRLVQLADKIQSAAEDRNGIMYELARHWTSLYDINNTVNLKPYVQHLVTMAMFGPVHKKGDKIVQDMNVYIATIDDLEPGKTEVNREDSRVRILIATFLLKLASTPGNERLLYEFATGVMATWREIVRTRRRHTFVNSLRHRETHRLVTSLVLVHQTLIVDRLEELLEFLCEILEQEGQPSVRFLAEWCLILILAEHHHKWSLIWENLSSRDDKKPAVQCSWLVILTHVGRLIPEQVRTDYLLKAVPTVLPLCMAHQFNPRIFGQACLLALWGMCQQDGLEKYSQISVVLDGIKNFVSVSSNSSKCTMTLLNHFSMVYHPREDFSIQTLYVSVPRLFGLSQDEWLDTSLFEEIDPEFWSRSAGVSLIVPLVNPRTRLENCQPGAWKLRTDDSEAISVMIGDVQRKITPWKRMLPIGETLDAEPSHTSSSGGGVILVASLIDKPANLGGLCRTCEIFGASQFIIGSLAYVKDPQFVGLSVSAQKWISITEVQPNFLRDYLLMQQRHGYTLVGVEQTNNSQCLTEYKFPEKTLLLLGNEKEGIPVDLIQLLDVCVEIPQQGVIRSLNVHVCGALLMWEYRRQHLS